MFVLHRFDTKCSKKIMFITINQANHELDSYGIFMSFIKCVHEIFMNVPGQKHEMFMKFMNCQPEVPDPCS